MQQAAPARLLPVEVPVRRLWLLLILGCDSSGAGSQQAAAHVICDQYVECVGHTTPQGLAAVLAAYGSAGACWTSAAEKVCLDACRTGLRDTRHAFPNESACPECLGDADCAGLPGTPACSGGRCVQCNADSFCGGATPACAGERCVECAADAQCAGRGVCDLSAHRCTPCVKDADCPQQVPYCAQQNGQNHCVTCRSDSDCGGGVCEGGSCCQPESCAEIAQYWSVGSGQVCGSTYSIRCSRGTVYCPACTRGSCDSNFNPPLCTLEGTACTPGMSGDCLADEVCTYFPNGHGYICAKDIRGSECVYGGDSYKCNDYHFDCDGASLAANGVCRAYCLTAADCRPNEKCSIWQGLGYGTCYPN
jgi:hypothetical protein